MRVSVLLCLLSAASASAATAEEQTPILPLPQLRQCQATARPLLPEKWQATFLMAPFTNAQLAISDIVHDDELRATRMKVYGVRSGALDLFVQGDKTYALHSDGQQITDCEDLGDTGWRPLPRDWLAPQSGCVGSAPLGETEVDWWKTPIAPAPASYWVWYKQSDQTPFRLVFHSANDRLGILSQHALTYQVRFNAVSRTDLGEAASACRAAKNPAENLTLHERLAAMAQSPTRANHAIEHLMPELAVTCSAAPLPTWPDQLAITGLMTPFDSNENPYPTEVLYDWSVPAQRTRVFFPPGSPNTAQDALMLGPRGYNVSHLRGRGPVCAPVLPGTVRPDWPVRAPCNCEAEIAGGTPVSTYGTTRVLACPLASPRAAWAWYSASGRPTLFMVTSLPGDEGFGLFAALDYRDWLPGHHVARSVFAMPQHCPMPPAPPGKAAPAAAPSHCATCHLGAPATQR